MLENPGSTSAIIKMPQPLKTPFVCPPLCFVICWKNEKVSPTSQNKSAFMSELPAAETNHRSRVKWINNGFHTITKGVM